MSEHRIEDLVEDGVRTILASSFPDAEKARIAARLYDFQARYDTSHTIGRLKPQLDAIGFSEDGAGGLPLLDAIAAVVARSDAVTVHDWIAALADGVFDGHLRDDVPASFAGFSTDGSALAIRAAAVGHGVAKLKSSRALLWRKPWKWFRGFFKRPDAAAVETKNIVRFLSDLSEPVEAVSAGYQADLDELAARASAPLTRIPELMEARGDFRFVAYADVGASKRPSWMFLVGSPPDDPDATRFYLTITHEYELGNVLVPTIGIQSGVLRQWQGLPFDSDELHFRRDIAELLKEKDLHADPQFAKGKIGWPYKAEQSEAILVKRLEALIGFVPAMLKVARLFYGKPIRELLDKNSPAELLAKRRKLAFEKGFFVNRIEIMCACACRAWERGDGPSQRMLDHVEALAQAAHETHPLKLDWVATANRLRSGPAFPRIDSVRMGARLEPVADWVD